MWMLTSETFTQFGLNFCNLSEKNMTMQQVEHLLSLALICVALITLASLNNSPRLWPQSQLSPELVPCGEVLKI